MEETKLTKLQHYIQQNSVMVGIFVAIQIIAIILFIVTINGINKSTFKLSNVPISNLSQDLENLPTNSVETIQDLLYDTITINQGTLNSISDSDAEVREGTMIDLYFENIDMHYVNFIVDIPSIQQSYQVFNEWSDDNSNPHYLINMVTMVMCPLKDQQIYNNQDCRDIFNHNGQKIIVSKFINQFDYNSFTPYFKEGDLSTVYINPAIPNVEDKVKQEYVQETKDMVDALGVSSDIFKYHVLEENEFNYNISPENQ